MSSGFYDEYKQLKAQEGTAEQLAKAAEYENARLQLNLARIEQGKALELAKQQYQLMMHGQLQDTEPLDVVNDTGEGVTSGDQDVDITGAEDQMQGFQDWMYANLPYPFNQLFKPASEIGEELGHGFWQDIDWEKIGASGQELGENLLETIAGLTLGAGAGYGAEMLLSPLLGSLCASIVTGKPINILPKSMT